MTETHLIRLANDADLSRAALALADRCKIMRAILARTGTPPLREFSADFAGLAKIVTGQQLSIVSARAIWARVAVAVEPFDAMRLLAMSDADLAALGLSRGKIKTLKAIATAIQDGSLDFAALAQAPDEAAMNNLTMLHGVGPWTADIYLLFALRRADAFPPGDLALQLSVQHVMKLKDRPTPAKLANIAERWRPLRAAAARLLWADYAMQRAKPPTDNTRILVERSIKSEGKA